MRGVALLSVLLVAFASVAACNASQPHESEQEGCATCHMAAFRSAKTPPHEGTRPTACGICHAQTSWRPTVMNHPWPLTGAHENAPCASCHTGTPPKFRGTKKECVACHKSDYDRGPEHLARKFPTTCQSCHSTVAWTDLLEHPTERVPPMPSGHPTPPPKPPAPRPKPSQSPAK